MEGKKLLKQWKADLQTIKEEKRKKKRKKRKSTNKKFAIPSNTANFMNENHVYYKRNGVWKQRDKQVFRMGAINFD